jgi:allantoicase
VDMSGKKVATVTENTSQIDVSHLSNGTYILKVSNGNYNYTQKLIKK